MPRRTWDCDGHEGDTTGGTDGVPARIERPKGSDARLRQYRPRPRRMPAPREGLPGRSGKAMPVVRAGRTAHGEPDRAAYRTDGGIRDADRGRGVPAEADRDARGPPLRVRSAVAAETAMLRQMPAAKSGRRQSEAPQPNQGATMYRISPARRPRKAPGCPVGATTHEIGRMGRTPQTVTS